MGIARDFADFLLADRTRGVAFGRTATFGRLNLFVDHHSLAAVFRQHGEASTDRDIRAMRAPGYAEAFLRRLGARETISVDASSYEGASLIHDMNQPIGDDLKGRFSTVIDGGTL